MVPGYRIERATNSSARIDKYLAKQTETNAECIINIVSLNGRDADGFVNDANAAAAMFHPNIVDIYSSGVMENGDAYYVSEAPRSSSLRELLNEGIPSLLTTIQIMRETAEAVHAMHSGGLVHGAIRPENIVVADDASLEHRVKVQNPDLGGVVCHSIISNKLTIDSAIDAVRYFAPEQFSLEASTPQTDVYALGTLLFEMLAGEPPFGGENASELIEKIRNEHPPDIKINNFDLRMLLTHTLMQSLQKQSGFRQPTALAFARQLRHMEQLATHSATPPVPFPGAIPQKQAAAAAVFASKSKPAPVPDSAKPIDKGSSSTTPSQPIALVPESITIPSIALSEDRRSDVQEKGTLEASTGDLNRSRLRNWKEKYQAVSSAFRSNSKSGLQQLSIAAPPARKEKAAAVLESTPQVDAAEVSKPTRIKIEWDQPNDDLPTLDDVKKVHAEGSIAQTAKVKENLPPAVEPAVPPAAHRSNKWPVRNELFGNFTKRPRVRKRASTVRDAGMFSSVAPLSGPAMNRRIAAGGFAIAVILGLFFGSSLLERKEARSAAAETQETKVMLPEVAEHARQEPTGSDLEPDETIVETPDFASKDASDSPRFALPNSPRPAPKDTVRDAVSDLQRKTSNSNAVTQAVNKQATAKAPPRPALTPSTLVISPGNGQVKKKVEPGNGSAFTRPRIVANPKP